MPRPYPEAVFMRLDATARVGWAKFYDEQRMANAAIHQNHVLLDRINVLLEALFDLVDDVLHGRNLKAFSTAMRVKALIEEFEKGRKL